MTVVGVVSAMESNSFTMPRFSVTNARPSDAKRTEVGRVRPEKIATSRKWESVKVPAASATGAEVTRRTGAATTLDAAMTAAATSGRTRRRNGLMPGRGRDGRGFMDAKAYSWDAFPVQPLCEPRPTAIRG